MYVFASISASTKGNPLVRYTFYFMRMRCKHSKFGCDGSTMKGALLAEQSTFSSVSRRLLEEIPWNSIFITFRACATKVQVWLRSVNNEGHFIWSARYVFVCISTSTRENFLELHINHFPPMRYKRSKFGCDRSIMNGTLLGEQHTFSSVSWLLLWGISWNFILFTFRTCVINTFKFGCDRPLTKGTLLWQQNTFSSVSQLVLGEIFCNVILFTFHTFAINAVSLFAIRR
jgi:hypothetical protein